MSEKIPSVLATLPQSFTTAEQKIGRDNIAAQAAGDYVSATTFNTFSAHVDSAKLDASASSQFQPTGNYQTAGDYAYNSAVSAKQDSSAMSSYVPFSAISADAGSAITSINGSSVGKFTGVSAGNCISGDGTSGSPLGLSSKIKLETSYSAVEIQPNYIRVNNHVGSSHIGNAYVTLENPLGGGATAQMVASALRFTDSANHMAQVDISSIDKWNSSLWNESANSLSTGFGGSQATAASQFPDGAGNWACRRVKCQGIPDQDLYGFQQKPAGTATAYMVNPAGAFVQYQSNYYCYLYHKTGSVYESLDTSIYPTGLTANARLDFVNLCSAASANIKTDTFHGSTADIDPGESATMWYIATADIWTDGNDQVPV